MYEAMLSENNIRLNACFTSKDEAIRACGELLLKTGYIEPGYVDAMVQRDSISTTYVGNGVAVPHGTEAAKPLVKKTGLAIIQVPGGVDFGKGRIAKLLIAVAAQGNEHIDLLTNIAQICIDDAKLNKMLKAQSTKEIMDVIRTMEKQ
ncbi:PTS sugar transporter subunit IIA [Gracilinema caldarium]|uniref:Phosphoenolpyruvate-dependent sugar phosphotransferase system EIIA 2 n=1 Tax=Gracilinema caldarium (strain ATCC 51460 / DSM 7334 / H1) TaxID=744872 RepID=F8F339_GRAC1|nr:PTS sugar transporter subunit IIA [Gracilinema caldarium]AEJ20365.1 phosphoenolpyruvate-dependent sugar phosphotransferase system EIIA 2 [Gracilinema caldarium DSM 7334]